MPRLLVIKGADEGKQFELDQPRLGIGRDAANSIRLHDTEVSRKHAELREMDGNFLLRDLGSANGTFVNNNRIPGEVILQAGDRIQIGQTLLVFSTGQADPRQEASDLAEQISLITRSDLELSSAIIKRVSETEGSRIFEQPERAKTPWLRTALANLTILYEASKAVSHILDLNEMLHRLLELVFGSIPADRGCMLLQNADTGEYEPKALHWRNKTEEPGKMMVSRTIVDFVLREKEGVLVNDAAQDDRFNTGQSIVRFGIREVICVPMKGRHETLGVLYLDTRTNARDLAERQTTLGKFTEDHLSLASAVAHQAALAVEETRYHQAMLQAERLAAIGQTIAALSHHIKNFLQGLKSGSEIIKMGLTDRKENLIQQGWKIVEKNQAKISDLVMDMLSYSKEREPSVEDTDINQLVRETVEVMEGRARELNVKFKVSLDNTLSTVQVDPVGIHRALLNLIGNALDAVEESKDPQVTIGTRRDAENGWVRIVVLDNGCGIPPEKLPDIFKPFVSTKGNKGTGLGLAVSRKIVREHGGDILVQSQVGKGSRFTIRLPLRSPLSVDQTGTGADLTIGPPPAD